jgi:hypothetical protein
MTAFKETSGSPQIVLLYSVAKPLELRARIYGHVTMFLSAYPCPDFIASLV